MRARKLIRLLSLAIPVAIGIAAVVIAVPRLGGQADQAVAEDGIVVSLDMDTTDGGPCADVDSSATHAAGESYDVAVCVEGLYGPPEFDPGFPIGALAFDILYDDTLNEVPEAADIGYGLDDNPDANAGATFWGDGLGDNWDCSGGGTSYPEGDKNPASGPGNGDAFIACRSSLGPWTLGDDETSGVIAVINFQALAAGDDTLSIANGFLGYTDASEMGTCNPDVIIPMACNGGEDIKGETQPLTVSLDMDTTDGGPCADIDSYAGHAPGESYDVAVCVEGLQEGYPIGGVSLEILYDDTLNRAPEVADVGAALDDNPDANAGTTTWGDSLGPEGGEYGWDCSNFEVAYPKGDKNPASGPGNGDAFIACRSIVGPWTLGDDETSGVLALVRFEALAEGADTMMIANGLLIYQDATEMGTCNPSVTVPMECNGGEDIKAELQELAVSLDMDTTDGGPCADIDSSASHDTGESYDVAICVEGLYLGQPVGVFSFGVLYDDTLNRAPEVGNWGEGLDDNPDANAGATTWGDSLGGGWDCSSSGIFYPTGDRNPASGPGNGEAQISCRTLDGPWTLGDDETSGVIAVIHFQAIAPGTDALTIQNGLLGSYEAVEIGTCNPEVSSPMTCNEGIDSKSGEVIVDWDGDGALDEEDNCLYVSNPDQADVDEDGIGDLCDNCPYVFDISQADSDGDGVGDACDSCVGVYNPGQENTPLGPIDNGPVVPGDDVTVPYEDEIADACDDDADNDWLDDSTEENVMTDPHNRDTDGDGFLDGAEFLYGTHPLDPWSKPTCPSDPDHDCLPSYMEEFFGSSNEMADTDGDGINDGIEVNHWGTSPTMRDTDGDGCDDDKEIVEINGDAVVNALDEARVALRVYNGQDDDPNDGNPIPDPDMVVDPAFDINKDGVMNALDPALVTLNSNMVEPAEECDCR